MEAWQTQRGGRKGLYARPRSGSGSGAAVPKAHPILPFHDGQGGRPTRKLVVSSIHRPRGHQARGTGSARFRPSEAKPGGRVKNSGRPQGTWQPLRVSFIAPKFSIIFWGVGQSANRAVNEIFAARTAKKQSGLGPPGPTGVGGASKIRIEISGRPKGPGTASGLRTQKKYWN